ncbi:hypothetical protein [Mucilaginibacter ginsenosidivorax]|uniref:Uncharacterized protein n=1 Tax=Mucilaginibacter ginsenosidivorax TaxID=862126 RepID=A0A5B8VXC6_9SPHI|nr:hypothetical protein [Mucilaginibacter ginsenosidivorax]QEC75265.1 hypothetical protein FSB76_04675 [Mucilaginibacter ginsenosidivorax]
MKRSVLLFLAALALLGCGSKKKKVAATVYPTISYLNIKLDAVGHLPSNPYILTFDNAEKHIVFCGVNHVDKNKINDPMYAGIEKAFFAFKPDVCVNEGGDVSKKVFASKQAALRKDGEIGLVKILADSLKIKTVNGDMTDSLEFKELLKKYTPGEFLAYIVTERFMWGLNEQQANDTVNLKKSYAGFIQNYIMKTGAVKLTPQQQTLAFYKTNYQKLLKRPFIFNELEPTNPFDPKGKFQEIGRASKEIRDQSLLATIDSLLKTHNKVFVVFGGWHLLTCEPGLKQIISRAK